MKTKAMFLHKLPEMKTLDCEIEKIIPLSPSEYAKFYQQLLGDYDFITDNNELMGMKDGTAYCILVMNEELDEGILVNSGGSGFARNVSFFPNDCSGKVTETLEALELGAYRECHPASLSGGQKQRVTIGAAIVKDSPVIYFDEPTSGLDYDSMVRVSHLIEQLAAAGVIIFVVSHDFEFITRTCSEVLQLDGQDSIKNQVLTPEILLSLSKQYFN